MDSALFINGIFEDVLEEVLKAHKLDADQVCVLQPYSGGVIKLLQGHDFSQSPSLPFYISTTSDLTHISYIADIVGWDDKRELINDPERLHQFNKQISKNQPIQAEVYFYSDTANTKECVNLIQVKNLKKLPLPFKVGNLIKVSDNTPYKPRTQAGGWSPVHSISPTLIEATETFLEETVQSDIQKQVAHSLSDSSEVRRKRLLDANKKPEVIQVISTGYKRNTDVIAEVLERAKGICERCLNPAPFIRSKDDTPYLEVHHIITLAQNGDDTVENAQALCPNCHREVHFGK
jgi:5-methylcytosine-specific restriction protein A